MNDTTKAASENLIAEIEKSGVVVERASEPSAGNKPGTIPLTVGRVTPISGAVNTPGLKPLLAKPVAPAKPVTTVAALARNTRPNSPIPSGLETLSTDTVLDDSFFRTVLYSVTSGRKTSTAHGFEEPEYVRTILTRDKSQMIPLAGEGYKYVHANDATKFSFAMNSPEKLWPDWAEMPDPDKRRTIIVDDLTKALDVMVKSALVKDKRMAYRDAKNDLDEMVTGLSRKPYNLIIITLAKIGENIKDNDEIGPEMSPSLLSYITAEFSAVLYVDIDKWQILTDRDKFGVGVDERGNVLPQRRIFAKHKLPRKLVGKGLINLYEPLDLKAFWKKLRAAQGTAVGK